MNIHSFIALCWPDNQIILTDTNILNYGIFFHFSGLNEKEKLTRYPKPAQSSTVLLEKLRVLPQRINEFLTFYVRYRPHNSPPLVTNQRQMTPILFIQNLFQFYFPFYF